MQFFIIFSGNYFNGLHFLIYSLTLRDRIGIHRIIVRLYYRLQFAATYHEVLSELNKLRKLLILINVQYMSFKKREQNCYL